MDFIFYYISEVGKKKKKKKPKVVVHIYADRVVRD